MILICEQCFFKHVFHVAFLEETWESFILIHRRSTRGSFKVLRAVIACLSSLPDLCSPNTSDGTLIGQTCRFP